MAVNWRERLRKRLQGLALLLLLSGLISFIFWLFYLLAFAWLPLNWQLWLTQLQTQPLQASLLSLRQGLEGLPLMPLLFMALQLAQVLLAPIPGQVMGLLGGWLFGFWGGLALTMAGLMLGSSLAMGLTRWGGRPLLEKLVPAALLKRFDHLIASGGVFTFFMLFLLPALPDDAICLVAGLTQIRMRWLLLVCFWGRLPGMAVLTWAGQRLENPAASSQGLLIGLGLASLLLWLFQDQVEIAFARWSKKRQAGRQPADNSANT